MLRLIQFQGENAIRLVDFGQRTKWTVPNPDTHAWLKAIGIPQVSGPQPNGELFMDLGDLQARDNAMSDRVIALLAHDGPAGVSGISDGDLERIAKAVNDEVARRLSA